MKLNVISFRVLLSIRAMSDCSGFLIKNKNKFESQMNQVQIVKGIILKF